MILDGMIIKIRKNETEKGSDKICSKKNLEKKV